MEEQNDTLIQNNSFQQRENQFDFLRVFAMISVVFIHAVTSKTSAFQQTILMIAGIAVPTFFFLSGAFTLPKENTLQNLKQYYLNKLFKIVIPYFCFAICYFLYPIFVSLIHRTNTGEVFREVSIRLITTGIPGNGYHLWFMYVIVAFYCMAPALIWLRKKNLIIYLSVAAALFIFAELYFYLDLFKVPWFLRIFEFLPLIVLGDVLKNLIHIHSKKWLFLTFFILTFAVCIVSEMILKMPLVKGTNNQFAAFILHDGSKTTRIVDPEPFQIINLLASVSIFLLFKLFNIPKNISIVADFCFYIYLIHFAFESICLSTINKMVNALGLSLSNDAWFFILVLGMFVLLVSSTLVLIIKLIIWLFKKIYKTKQSRPKNDPA